jgi:hypothetical protein
MLTRIFTCTTSCHACMMPKASEQLRGCLCLEAEREADDMSLKFFWVAHAGWITSLLGWFSVANPVADSELMVSVSACLFLVFVYIRDRWIIDLSRCVYGMGVLGGPKVSTRIAMVRPAFVSQTIGNSRRVHLLTQPSSFSGSSRVQLNSAILSKASEQRRGCPRLVADRDAGRWSVTLIFSCRMNH